MSEGKSNISLIFFVEFISFVLKEQKKTNDCHLIDMQKRCLSAALITKDNKDLGIDTDFSFFHGLL